LARAKSDETYVSENGRWMRVASRLFASAEMDLFLRLPLPRQSLRLDYLGGGHVVGNHVSQLNYIKT